MTKIEMIVFLAVEAVLVIGWLIWFWNRPIKK